jgi:serine/threonine protein kinase
MLKVGDILEDKYEIESFLGRGGMGVVYRARHLGLGAPRAIKIMHRELAENEDYLERFRNEAKLAEELRHPNVVTLYDLSPLPDGTPYIVWEYVEGETLSQAFRRGVRFTPEESVELVAQVASGLAAAHERHIIHRDISPDNLMLTSDSQGGRSLKVLDFGMAKFVGSITEPGSGATATGVFLGKMGYSSPEQVGLFEDEDPLDEKSDVFSLAVVAYRMLAGRLPFRTTNVQTFLYDLTTAPEEEVRVRFTKDLDPRFRGAFARALRRDRQHRTPSTLELSRELSRALGDEMRPASIVTSIRTEERSSTRRRLFGWAMVASLLLAVALLPRLMSPRTTGPSETGPERREENTKLPDPVHTVSSPARNQTATLPRPGEGPAATSAEPTLTNVPKEKPSPTPPPPRPLSLVVPEAVPTSDPLPERNPPEAPTVPAKDVSYGSISITSEVWVEVQLDDGAPEQTPVFLRRVPAGPHSLRVRRRGEPERLLTITVQGGETTALRLDPTWEP